MRRVRGRSKVVGYFRSLTVPGLCFCHGLIEPLMVNCDQHLLPLFGKISTRLPEYITYGYKIPTLLKTTLIASNG